MSVVRKSYDGIIQEDTIVDINDSPKSDITEFEGSLPEFKTVLDVLVTKIRQNGHDKIRAVLFGMWFVHFAIMITIIWLSFNSQNMGETDRLGLFMIVLQLYFAKILKSLNQMYDKTIQIQSDLKSIQEDVVEISKIYKDQKKAYKVVLTDKQYIMIISDLEHRFRSLATYILKDLYSYINSIRVISLIINAFFWKSPYYNRYLERDGVSEAIRIINRHIDRKVNRYIEIKKIEDNKIQQQAMQQSNFFKPT